mgnify:CR=1 FL=1|tara:strand:+ start:147 stop:368 length:222 start_codon:yes stop_codon:yes gene_type:complete
MKEFITSDLALAAYLTFKGLKLINAEKLPTGRFKFVIDNTDETADALSLEYFSSDFSKFDNQLRSLKKLLYSS